MAKLILAFGVFIFLAYAAAHAEFNDDGKFGVEKFNAGEFGGYQG